jgi:hypothetical protein
MSDEISWEQVNNLVAPEHQYLKVKNVPLSNVRMAWPFKTEAELVKLSKWFKWQQSLKAKATKAEVKKSEVVLGPALF